MKQNFTLLFIMILAVAGCKPQKKFTATEAERAKYNQAYAYLKNMKTHLADKEIEPGARQALLEAADKLVSFGDVDELEQKIPYEYFRKSLEKAEAFTAQFQQQQIPDETSGEYKTADVKYKTLQKKLNGLKDGQLEKNLEGAGIEPMAKRSILFMADQFKKYDLPTFFKKTIVPFSGLDASIATMEQVISLDDMDVQLKLLEEQLKGNN
jgi:hypothetical protein